MRINTRCVVAFAAACSLAAALSDVTYGQISKECDGVDAGCLISETPVPGVRIVRLKDYPKRPAHYVSGDLYTTLAAAQETRNRFTVLDFTVPPGGGPIPHGHTHEWETFFVVEGTVNLFVDISPVPPFNVIEQPASAGTLAYSPKCRVMGFANRSGAPARILALALPAGVDNFFHLVGKEVVDYYGPIPPPTPDEFLRLAFWGERETGTEEAYFPGGPPPTCAGVPQRVVTSTTDPTRPRETGPFGETRVVLLTKEEVGTTTGATAFCGFGFPGVPREGGSAKYTYFSLPPRQGDFPAFHTSANTEFFYTLRGTLSLLFGGEQQKRVHVEPLSYVEIQPGVPFSIANLQGGRNSERAEALGVSIIAPDCGPSFPMNP